MRNLVLTLTLIGLIASGCTRYQFYTMGSQLQQNEKGNFIFNSDTLSIAYHFSFHGDIVMEIVNKSDQLLYVDWQRSAIVYNEQAQSYPTGITQFEGFANSGEYLEGLSFTSITGRLSGMSAKKFLPPKSKTTKIFKIVPIDYQRLSKSKEAYEKVALPGIYGKKYNYTVYDSAHYISSYLYMGNDNGGNGQMYRHDFWVEEILETMTSDVEMKGHQFQKSKITGVGNVFLGLGLAALTIVYVAAEIEE